MSDVFFYQGKWYDEPPRILSPMDHAFWMASVVFDGARSFNGLAPDLDRHCARLGRSAKTMSLAPPIGTEEITELAKEGIRKLPKEAELYVRPMMFATTGFVAPDPESTQFVLAIHEMPLPEASGFAACFTEFSRPAKSMAPVEAKASCLYPNNGRALQAARNRGFDNGILMDANDNVAEFATSNIWIAKDGVAFTPAATGTFLAGITRQRVMQLLRDDGIEVVECPLNRRDVMDADEVFNTGNYGKVMPVTRLEDREMQPGPIAKRARELYFEFANQCRVF
jgi:branched-chain amino acid aminotransferase